MRRAGCTLANASYIPPPPNELMPCLGALETFLHERSLPPLVQIAMAHYQFEAIHPFLDGNDRVGRLLVTLFLVERGVLPQPLLYLSAAGLPSRTPVLLLDMLAENPFLTVTKAAKKLGVAFTTVQRAVNRLESLSILTQVGEAKRDRIYCAKELLAILDEPAQLTPTPTSRKTGGAIICV